MNKAQMPALGLGIWEYQAIFSTFEVVVLISNPRFTCVNGFLYYPRLSNRFEGLIRTQLLISGNTF
jgi:hypothetical protein